MSNEGGRQVDDERVAFPFRVQKSVARPRSALHWGCRTKFLAYCIIRGWKYWSVGVRECCMIGFKPEGNGLGESADFEGFSGAFIMSHCRRRQHATPRQEAEVLIPALDGTARAILALSLLVTFTTSVPWSRRTARLEV